VLVRQKNHGALNDVFKLSDITGPCVF
jgi:hypothetical protein